MKTEEKINTIAGIIEYLNNGIAGMNELQSNRKLFKDKCKLEEFTILDGQFILDQFGQLNKSIEKIPGLGLVVPGIISKGYSIGIYIPTEQIKCKHCNEKWSLENMNDFVLDQNQIISIKGAKFIGKKVSKVWGIFRKKSDALYIPDTANYGITNKKWIDLTPNPKQKNWNKNNPDSLIVLNEKGKFLGSKEDLANHVICKGDEIWFFKTKASHLLCTKSANISNEKLAFTKTLETSNFTIKKVVHIPNEYHGCNNPQCHICTDWFMFYTQFGPIKIGTRKRVYEINWEGTGLNCNISKDDVTKGSTMIHAWSLEKMAEYLNELFNKLSKKRSKQKA